MFLLPAGIPIFNKSSFIKTIFKFQILNVTEYLYHKVVLIEVFDLFLNRTMYISNLGEYICISQVY